MKILKYILLFLFVTCSWTLSNAQSGRNPFELTPRLAPELTATPDTSANSPDTVEQGNPFDIKVIDHSKSQSGEEESIIATPESSKPKLFQNKETVDNAFLFPVVLTILVLLTIFITLFRTYVTRVYTAIFNDNMLHQLYSDRLNVGMTTAFTPLYLLFFMNAGLFVFLVANYFGVLPEGNNYLTLLYITLGILAIFALKHIILFYIGTVFPARQETSSYNFTIIVFSIFIGLVLIPLNLSIAYMPENLTKWLIIGTAVFIILTYILRGLRGIFIADKYLQFHKFHFLLYICTVEITPVLFLYRFFSNQLQG